jgi:NAD-dependent DNA ligase
MFILDQESILILAPTHCPSCNSTLEWSNDLLYCRSPNCSASTLKALEHFASTLKIKGLGPSTIAKLELSCFEDIYLLSLDNLIKELNSEKIAIKLFEEIELSKSRPLNSVLSAFGIPLIGKTAADKLSKVCSSIYDINEQTCKQAGLGEKATTNLLEWLSTNDIENLPFDLKFETPTIASTGVICISGKLNSYTSKQEANIELEQLGFIVKTSVTKDVTFLVNESGRETAKTQKARESGITIITDLKKFIGEFNK